MTVDADLERGYLRWLRWYPKAFRREHEAEILGVLVAYSREGQRRSALLESLDLLSSAEVSSGSSNWRPSPSSST